MPWSSYMICRFADVRDKVPGSSSSGAYNALLCTFFPIDSDFTVFPRPLTAPDKPVDRILMFDVLLKGKLVLMLGVKPSDDLELPSARESADTQIQSRIRDMAGWLRSQDPPLSGINHT